MTEEWKRAKNKPLFKKENRDDTNTNNYIYYIQK